MDFVPFQFERPWMLALGAAAIAWTIWIARRSIAGQSRFWHSFSLALRIAVLILVTLGLADTRFAKRSERLTVLFLIDSSASVPTELITGEDGVLDKLAAACAALTPGESAGVIRFGADAAVETQPDSRFLLPRMQAVIDREGTDLAAALRLADATFAGAEGMRRVVVISDGNFTQGDEMAEARNLAASGAVIDAVPIRYTYPTEVFVESVQVPTEVHREEPYLVGAIVHSEIATSARVVLTENDRVMAERTVDLAIGKSRIDFPLVHSDAERFRYEIRVFPQPDAAGATDTLLKNNVGFAHTMIRGAARVLFVGDPTEHSQLQSAFESARIACDTVPPPALSLLLEDYYIYDTIVVGNVAAHEFGADALKLLAGVVKNLGIGFIMVGGPDAFGAGGYEDTPIEKMLPVDMDVKQRKVLPNGALAMILHTCEFADGNLWAKRIAKAAVDCLHPRDYVGVLLWDYQGRDSWGVPLAQVAAREKIKEQINLLAPMDMQAFEPSMQLAHDGLVTLPATLKHVIIISDGDPAPPSGALMQQFLKDAISVSTICILPHGNADTGVMKKIALDTGGRYYFVEDERKLPQIFIREAQQIHRSLILEEAFVPQVAYETEPLRGIAAGGLPQLFGHVLTTAKSLAEVPLVNQYGDPVLAHWRYGLGKSAAFTSDATGRWAREWLAWAGFETFWAQLVRFVARRGADEIFRVDRSIDGDRGKILLDAIDAEGHFIDGLEMQGTVLNPAVDEEAVTFQQTGPGRYETEFGARLAGTYLLSFAYKDGSGLEGMAQTGLTVSYSPEYRHLRSNEVRLAAVAEATEGRVLDWDGDFFDRSLPARLQSIAIWERITALVILLFVLDVFFRRVLLSLAPVRRLLARFRRGGGIAESTASQLVGTLLKKRRAAAPGREGRQQIPVRDVDPRAAEEPDSKAPLSPPPPSAPAPESQAPAEGTSFTDRLLEAKRRALRKANEEEPH